MGGKLLSVVCCLLLVLITLVSSQDDDRSAAVCHEEKTCGACIAAGPKCGWCTQEGYDADNKRRCDILENLVSLGCEYSFIKRPEHEITIDQDLEVRNAEDGKEAIQLKPQEMTIKLRPNKPYKFNVTFRQAENYPVDLYYVMDLSYSMGDDKSKLAELGDLLAQSMSEITTNFRLGFGSFVDKKTMPYVSMIPEKLETPCTGCAAPYGFHNQLRLTDDTSQFRTKVLAAPISGNLDSPEGGFDAIMQAIACKNEVGWREQSRKMLLFSTDAGFHYAGDGKLGGIVKPNDGDCHLDAAGYYSESLNQDYPSISQISNKIADKKVNVIFAVTENQVDMYKELSAFIEGSTVGELANDSSNVVTLVRENYEKISSIVELKTEGAEDVDVTFRTRCFGNETMDSAACKGLGIGQNVTFEVSIEVTECPVNREEWSKDLKIYPVGLTESLIVHLDLICECDCEQPSEEEPNSAQCNGQGTFECGACTCHGKYYGKNCECDGSQQEGEDYTAACKRTNTSRVCEGRGACSCGACDCFSISTTDPNKRYSGAFCQCDDYSCDYSDNQLCGGPERGVCDCGVCKCKKEYKGSACECPISNESCMAENGELCNGKGTCKCGRCTCHKDTYYRGRTCEDCPTCEGKCDANKACVQCRAFDSGPIEHDYECAANCSHVTMVDSVEETKNRKLCTFSDDDGCMFYFAYEYDSDRVYAQKTKECREQIKLWWIILAIILAILLIGIILLLIWKCCATLIDRREFAKFEKERQNAKWDTGENPIYKQATTTFNNPTYRGKN